MNVFDPKRMSLNVPDQFSSVLTRTQEGASCETSAVSIETAQRWKTNSNQSHCYDTGHKLKRAQTNTEQYLKTVRNHPRMLFRQLTKTDSHMPEHINMTFVFT